jgi:hypothetical protein
MRENKTTQFSMKQHSPVTLPVLLVITAIVCGFTGGCASDKQGVVRRSPYTIAEAKPLVREGMMVWEVEDALKTKPVMVRGDRFRWNLKDGTIYTNFEKAKSQWKVTSVETKLEDNPQN